MTNHGLSMATGTDGTHREPSRRTLLRNGLLLAAGAMAVVTAPVLTGAGPARAAVAGQGTQPQWSWCQYCQSLFYGPFQGNSFCPGLSPTGRHSVGTRNYLLLYGYASVDNDGYGQQADWNWCFMCQALFYGPFQGNSVCPAPAAAGGNHNGAQSYSYDMVWGEPFPGEIFVGGSFQNGWLWCDKCMGTFYGPFQGNSACPAGDTHNGSESRTYDVNFT